MAELIGCKVVFLGEQTKSRKVLQLLYAAVREALTNAVRHANATELAVKIEQNEQSYHIEISDNSNVTVSKITEGNGLSALQQRLEQEGSSLKVLCDNSVSLIVDIPFDLDDSQKGGWK
ncbi:MAG: ATP-binding protein [Bacillota bacterium]